MIEVEGESIQRKLVDYASFDQPTRGYLIKIQILLKTICTSKQTKKEDDPNASFEPPQSVIIPKKMLKTRGGGYNTLVDDRRRVSYSATRYTLYVTFLQGWGSKTLCLMVR